MARVGARQIYCLDESLALEAVTDPGVDLLPRQWAGREVA
jgi:hypothetical protein